MTRGLGPAAKCATSFARRAGTEVARSSLRMRTPTARRLVAIATFAVALFAVGQASAEDAKATATARKVTTTLTIRLIKLL